ncbi:MAG: hypothetical protein K2Y05_06240 [Hyphomicrobiaceae bacterium]|nr:hypothetical protein [Hyphomicrobiaceae bacterium]
MSLIVGLTSLVGTATSHAASLGMLGVEVENRSESQLCAEKDNVTLLLRNSAVTQFRIEAAHPAYIDTLQRDNFAADWTACDIKADAGTASDAKLGQHKPPVKTTIYEDVELWVTGYNFGGFWRDAKVPFRVGDKVAADFHVVQVWVRRDERAEEVLVVYPPDGYWRARPLPPKHLGWSAYGSSFLVGPVEDVVAPGPDGTPGGSTRPIVDLDEIVFDPKAKSFTVKFKRGGSATVQISKLDRDRQRLDVTFDAAAVRAIATRPFAAMRSMYVTEFNNDVARTAVLEAGAKSWREDTIMSFAGAKAATDVWTGRLVPSRHNTSAPDHVFSAFSDGTKQPPNWRSPWDK